MPVIHPFPYFRGFTQYTPTIPTLYWNVYSQEQRIKALCMEYAKLIAFSDSMVDTLNDTFDIVEDMNARLPELIDDSVNEALIEMRDSGELQSIIKTIIETLFVLNDTFTVSYVGALPYQRSTEYGNFQGGCYIPDTNELVTVELNSGGREALVKKIQPLTGIVNYSNVLEIGHANTMTYNDVDGYLYASGVIYFEGHNKDVYKINKETLTIVDTIELDPGFDIYGLTFVKDSFYCVNQYISSENTPFTIVKYDETLQNEITRKEFTEFGINLGRSIVAFGNIGEYFAAYSSNPRTVYLFDGELNLVRTINLNSTVNGYMYLGELEWISGNDINNIYLGYIGNDSSGSGTGFHCIGKTYATAGVNSGSYTTQLATTNKLYIKVLEDETTSRDWHRDGSEAHPFSNWWEAANCLQNSDIFSYVRIDYVNETTFESEFPIVVHEFPNCLRISSNVKILATRCRIERSPNVHIRNIASAYYEGTDNANIFLDNAKLYLDDYPISLVNNKLVLNIDASSELRFNGYDNSGLIDFSDSMVYGVVSSRLMRNVSGMFFISDVQPESTYAVGAWHNFTNILALTNIPADTPKTIYMPRVENAQGTIRINVSDSNFTGSSVAVMPLYRYAQATIGAVYNFDSSNDAIPFVIRMTSPSELPGNVNSRAVQITKLNAADSIANCKIAEIAIMYE